MFPEIFSGNILKYVRVCKYSKIFIKIFERTCQSVADKDKFKYFDEHLISLTYGIIVKNVP